MNHSMNIGLILLERLLLEIRNLEGENILLAPKLAYIFHNIPGLLKSHLSDSDMDEALNVILSRAEQLSIKDWISEWIITAKGSGRS